MGQPTQSSFRTKIRATLVGSRARCLALLSLVCMELALVGYATRSVLFIATFPVGLALAVASPFFAHRSRCFKLCAGLPLFAGICVVAGCIFIPLALVLISLGIIHH